MVSLRNIARTDLLTDLLNLGHSAPDYGALVIVTPFLVCGLLRFRRCHCAYVFHVTTPVADVPYSVKATALTLLSWWFNMTAFTVVVKFTPTYLPSVILLSL